MRRSLKPLLKARNPIGGLNNYLYYFGGVLVVLNYFGRSLTILGGSVTIFGGSLNILGGPILFLGCP